MLVPPTRGALPSGPAVAGVAAHVRFSPTDGTRAPTMWHVPPPAHAATAAAHATPVLNEAAAWGLPGPLRQPGGRAAAGGGTIGRLAVISLTYTLSYTQLPSAAPK